MKIQTDLDRSAFKSSTAKKSISLGKRFGFSGKKDIEKNMGFSATRRSGIDKRSTEDVLMDEISTKKKEDDQQKKRYQKLYNKVKEGSYKKPQLS